MSPDSLTRLDMKRTVYISLSLFITIIKCTPTDETKRNQTIKGLEKEKAKIFVEITAAIEDSIKTLRKSNDTDALEGIQYMNELKDQLVEFNSTTKTNGNKTGVSSADNEAMYQIFESVFNNHTYNITNITKVSGRRQLRSKYEENNDRIKAALIKYSKLKGSFNNDQGVATSTDPNAKPKVLSKKVRDKMKNRERIDEKLQKWEKEREANKEKMRQYRIQAKESRPGSEDCPAYGLKGKKSKTSSRKDRYPCCRKCCKKSVLGCLK